MFLLVLVLVLATLYLLLWDRGRVAAGAEAEAG